VITLAILQEYEHWLNALEQCMGSSLTLCGSGFSFLGECRSGFQMNADPDPRCTLKKIGQSLKIMLNFNENQVTINFFHTNYIDFYTFYA
jgi:hypothetical protein